MHHTKFIKRLTLCIAVSSVLFSQSITAQTSLKQVQVNGTELHYIEQGKGVAIIFVHAIEKLLEMDQNQQLDPATLMWAYLGMGNTQQTFAYLEKAYAVHSNTLASLKVEPCFDPLRGDSRFQELLRRVGLAQ